MNVPVTDVQLASLGDDVMVIAVDRKLLPEEFDRLLHAHHLIDAIPLRGTREWGGLLYERNHTRAELNRRYLEPKHGIRLDSRGNRLMLETVFQSGMRKVFKLPVKVRASILQPVKAFIRNEPALRKLVQEPERFKSFHNMLGETAEYYCLNLESLINGLMSAYGIDDQGIRGSQVIVFSRLAKVAKAKRKALSRPTRRRKPTVEGAGTAA
jgi:hypothetical protein